MEPSLLKGNAVKKFRWTRRFSAHNFPFFAPTSNHQGSICSNREQANVSLAHVRGCHTAILILIVESYRKRSIEEADSSLGHLASIKAGRHFLAHPFIKFTRSIRRRLFFSWLRTSPFAGYY
jgi:hypothetical protein